VKRAKEQLENLGKLEFKTVSTKDELEQYLPQCFNLHKKRWYGYYISSQFSAPDGKRFYKETAKEFLAKNMIKLDLLLLDGKVIAFSYSFEKDGRFFYYTPAFDSAYAKYSPGTVLLLHILEDAFKQGIKEFDLGKGETLYKAHWTTGVRKNRRIIFASPTLKGKMSFYFYLLYLSLFSVLRKFKFLRIVLGKLR